jgi:proteasome lid subunit RPN8/RPN11
MNFAEILQGHDLTGTNERVGFILSDGNVIECPNIAPDPETSFKVDPKVVRLWANDAAATWHTHPGGSSNLSTDDLECFIGWGPDMKHVIVGKDDMAVYYFEDGELLRE